MHFDSQEVYSVYYLLVFGRPRCFPTSLPPHLLPSNKIMFNVTRFASAEKRGRKLDCNTERWPSCHGLHLRLALKVVIRRVFGILSGDGKNLQEKRENLKLEGDYTGLSSFLALGRPSFVVLGLTLIFVPIFIIVYLCLYVTYVRMYSMYMHVIL